MVLLFFLQKEKLRSESVKIHLRRGEQKIIKHKNKVEYSDSLCIFFCSNVLNNKTSPLHINKTTFTLQPKNLLVTAAVFNSLQKSPFLPFICPLRRTV